jgi:hypothetical protein
VLAVVMCASTRLYGMDGPVRVRICQVNATAPAVVSRVTVLAGTGQNGFCRDTR